MNALDLPDEVIEAARLIREKYPTAVSYGVTSSDQASYGFRLTRITLEDGQVIDDDSSDTWPELSDEIDEELNNVSWGTFGDRNIDDSFDIKLATHRIIRREIGN